MYWGGFLSDVYRILLGRVRGGADGLVGTGRRVWRDGSGDTSSGNASSRDAYLQADAGAFAGDGPDGQAGIHHGGAALHAGEAIAGGRGGLVESAAVVADGEGEALSVKADFEEGLGCECI